MLQYENNKIDWYKITLFGYFVIALLFTIFWIKNCYLYTIKKGDEYSYFIGYHILIASFFNLLLSAALKKFKYLLFAFISLLPVVPGIFITIAVDIIFVQNTNTKSTLITYGLLYSSLCVFLTQLFLKQTVRKKEIV